MGEIADMMLDGTLCQECGVFMDGAAGGFPQSCASCRSHNRQQATAQEDRIKVACPTCGKRVKRVGLLQHHKDAHGVSSPALGKNAVPSENNK